MTASHLARALFATLLLSLFAAGHMSAAPNSPGGSELPSNRDSCENIGKYFNADYDRDGLSGYQECQLGSDPKDADTDNDGLTDDTEASLGSDLTLGDTDGDQLSDCWELAKALDGWPTHPLADGFDADGDGIPDALEIQVGLNPGNIDTDQDMLWDGVESLPQGREFKGPTWYSALNPDRDGDGLVDGVEVESLGTSPNKVDTDDGYSDGDEFLKWGTDPLDPNEPSTSNPPDYHP